jgi:hypothetical protein
MFLSLSFIGPLLKFLICHTLRFFPTAKFATIFLPSYCLFTLTHSLLFLSWDQAVLLSLEAVATSKCERKHLWTFHRKWHGCSFLLWGKYSAINYTCAVWIGTCRYLRNAVVWREEWGLDFLSVSVPVIATNKYIATYSEVAFSPLPVNHSILDWDCTHFHWLNFSTSSIWQRLVQLEY